MVRDPSGFRLSARAEEIYDQLSTVVPLLEHLLSPNDFDPSQATQPVSLAGTDYAAQLFGPKICQQVRAESPNTSVHFRNLRLDGILEQIRSGAVDIGLYGGNLPTDVQSELIFVEPFSCVMAREHPLSSATRISLDDYLRYPHVVIDTGDSLQSAVDRPLARIDRPRDAAVIVPYHWVAPGLLPGSDLIATLPSRLSPQWVDDPTLNALPAPTEIAAMPYRMIWNRALNNDHRHKWLRDIVRTAAAVTASAA